MIYDTLQLQQLKKILQDSMDRGDYSADFCDDETSSAFRSFFTALTLYSGRPETLKDFISCDLQKSPRHIIYRILYDEDMRIVPLHLNDVYKVVAAWRLEQATAPLPSSLAD